VALRSVAVLRPGALGDSLLILPALHAFRAAGVERILVLGTPASWAFLRPGVPSAEAQAVSLRAPADTNGRQGSAAPVVRVVDAGGTDWAWLFAEGLPPSAAAREALADVELACVYLKPDRGPIEKTLRAAGVPRVVGATPPLMFEHAAEGDPAPHAVARLLAPLRESLSEEAFESARRGEPLRQEDDPFLAVAAEERVSALRRLGLEAPPPGGFFAVHPGSGGKRKCWPAVRYAELTRRAAERGSRPLVLLGPADEETRDVFRRAAPGGAYQLAESFPLREVLALLSCARVFVGNDAGVTHLAARACPTLVLFGPTDPRVWRPLGARVTVLQAPDGRLERLACEEVWEAVEARGVPRSGFRIPG